MGNAIIWKKGLTLVPRLDGALAPLLLTLASAGTASDCRFPCLQHAVGWWWGSTHLRELL